MGYPPFDATRDLYSCKMTGGTKRKIKSVSVTNIVVNFTSGQFYKILNIEDKQK